MLSISQNRIRLDTFNLIKGLLMLSIVIGHKVPTFTYAEYSILWGVEQLADLVRAGCNPAFFMIAGCGMRVLTTKKCLKKTVNELLKPYLYVMIAFGICFTLIHYAVFSWWPGAIGEAKRFILAFLLGIPVAGKVVFGYQLYDCTAVWFLLSLFISYNILNWILQRKDVRVQAGLAAASTIAGYMLSVAGFVYYCIPQGLMGVGFCYVGFLIKKHELYRSKWLPVILIALSAAAVYEYEKGGFSMTHAIYEKGFAEVILAACSGALLVFVGIIISRVKWRILKPIKAVGIYTYWIICIHSVELSCIPWYKWSAFMRDHQLLGFIGEMIISGLIYWSGCMLLKKLAKYRYRRRQAANG